MIESPWIRLSAQLIDRWRRDEMVLIDEESARLADELADWLAGQAGTDRLGPKLGEWLLAQRAVEDVFASDDELAATVLEEAGRVQSSGRPRPAADGQETHELPPAIADLLERLGRCAFRPQVNEGDDGAVTASKFGGSPYLPPREKWPSCANCDQPLQFFVQLDLAALPEELEHPHRTGLVQLFYCTNPETKCESACEAWLPGAKSVLARWVPAPGPRAKPKASSVENQRPPFRNKDWKPGVITGWRREAKAELPSQNAEPGILAEDAKLLDESWDEIHEHDLFARPGDKLGGWPDWVQDPEYAPCPTCGKNMRYLLQLESNGLTGHQFGDLGAGHLCQCDDHPEQVALTWACH